MNESLPPATWRLVRSAPARGAWNMAVDEAILEHVLRGEVPPTLRLYAWEPPCLSLGHAQPFAEVDAARLQAHGWEVVRRPTGGRAILHADELTYSVTAPQSEPRLRGNVIESYKRLAAALLNALHRLGLPAEALPKKEESNTRINPEPICFEVPSHYEITVQGKKLIGSAQARKRGGVLQHGTLPLSGDLRRITQALRFPDEVARARAAERLLQRAATLEALLQRPVTWESAADALQAAFEQTLNLTFEHSDLTPGERERAEQLMQKKYARPEWTERI